MQVIRFLDTESPLYVAEGHNRLQAAAARAATCERYVDEIFRRYLDAAAVFNATMRSVSLSDGIPDIEKMSLQSMRVHLEIESFYVFGKMQLDGIAQLLHWWFKDSRNDEGDQIARGLSIQRHRELQKNLPELVAAGSLSYPSELVELAKCLQAKVADYRDTEVTHDQSHSFPASLVSREGDVTIIKARRGPNAANEHHHREPLGEVNQLRIRYTVAAMQFLTLNRRRGPLRTFLKQA